MAAAQTRHAPIHELKALTRDQEALIQSQTRLVNHPTASLKAYYSAALKLFTKLQQHCTLMCLQTYPTPQAAQTASVEKIEAVPRKGHHCHPTKVAEQIGQTFHQPHLVADVIALELANGWQNGAMIGTATQEPPMSKRWRAPHRRRIKVGATVRRISATGASNRCATPCTSLPGNYIARCMGTAYYRRKRAEGKSYHVAVSALANVWVRIIYAMWHKHACYEVATFMAAQQAHSW